jgi:hypothetical protein
VFLLSFLLMFALPGKRARASAGQELADPGGHQELAEATTHSG